MFRFTVCIIVAMAFVRLAGSFSGPRLSDEEIHRVTGAATGRSASAISAGDLRVVTWNIERGVKFEQIASTLAGFDADVILLQEVDRNCQRSGGRDVARDLADRLGMNWISAGEFQELGEESGESAALTGQALLSKRPIADPHVIAFSSQARLRWRFNPLQPRRGGRIALRARVDDVVFYTIHIESGGDDHLRRRQIDETLADASGIAAPAMVIGGDFNNVPPPKSTMFTPLSERGFVSVSGAGAPTSIRHQHPIDWIFTRGFAQTSAHVQLVARVSDHYPIVATLKRSGNSSVYH
jgi:endonuclease/exonuclease/phosphatase family metal-dependent hydrolase